MVGGVLDPGGVLAVLGMFLLTTAFYAATAHVAARYVLGDVPVTAALLVGPVPALAMVALLQVNLVLAIVVAVVADFVAIKFAYDIRKGLAAIVTVVHYAVSALSVFVIASIAASI